MTVKAKRVKIVEELNLRIKRHQLTANVNHKRIGITEWQELQRQVGGVLLF